MSGSEDSDLNVDDSSDDGITNGFSAIKKKWQRLRHKGKQQSGFGALSFGKKNPKLREYTVGSWDNANFGLKNDTSNNNDSMLKDEPTAEEFVRNVFSEIGIPAFKQSEHIRKLKDIYISTLEQLDELDTRDWERLEYSEDMVNAIKDKLNRTYNSATGTYSEDVNVNASEDASKIHIHKREKVSARNMKNKTKTKLKSQSNQRDELDIFSSSITKSRDKDKENEKENEIDNDSFDNWGGDFGSLTDDSTTLTQNRNKNNNNNNNSNNSNSVSNSSNNKRNKSRNSNISDYKSQSDRKRSTIKSKSKGDPFGDMDDEFDLELNDNEDTKAGTPDEKNNNTKVGAAGGGFGSPESDFDIDDFSD